METKQDDMITVTLTRTELGWLILGCMNFPDIEPTELATARDLYKDYKELRESQEKKPVMTDDEERKADS